MSGVSCQGGRSASNGAQMKFVLHDADIVFSFAAKGHVYGCRASTASVKPYVYLYFLSAYHNKVLRCQLGKPSKVLLPSRGPILLPMGSCALCARQTNVRQCGRPPPPVLYPVRIAMK